MFYKYEQRMDELYRISKIPNDEVKEKALKKFIDDELRILHGMQPPLNRSQALDCARRNLAAFDPRPINNQTIVGPLNF